MGTPLRWRAWVETALHRFHRRTRFHGCRARSLGASSCMFILPGSVCLIHSLNPLWASGTMCLPVYSSGGKKPTSSLTGGARELTIDGSEAGVVVLQLAIRLRCDRHSRMTGASSAGSFLRAVFFPSDNFSSRCLSFSFLFLLSFRFYVLLFAPLLHPLHRMLVMLHLHKAPLRHALAGYIISRQLGESGQTGGMGEWRMAAPAQRDR